MIRCLSVCSGIEAWSCAVEGMDGYSVSALSEIEPFPCAVLAERYPFVPNLGDMTKINGWAMRGQIDLLVGGTPCQNLSTAGKREGMSGEKSRLAWYYVRLAAELRVPWLLWENVPGALSTSGGADFRAFVSSLDELGYGLAWAVLDAQWFGVAQRRKRLFLVGRLGDWRGPGQVLFEPRRVCRNPPARRRKGEGNPSPAERGAGAGSREEGVAIFAQNQREEVRMLDVPGALAAEPGTHQQSYVVQNVCPTMTSSGAGFARVDGRAEHDCGTLVVQPNEVSPSVTASGAAFARTGQHGTEVDALVVQPNEVSATLCASGAGTDRPSAQASQEGFCVVSTPPACPLDLRHLRRDDASWGGLGAIDEPTTTMTSMNTGGGNPLAVAQLQPPLLPRRLTPVECERLQGFPDGWTAIQFQGKPAKDSHRYRALGNSMAVPVMRWLAEGIREFF